MRNAKKPIKELKITEDNKEMLLFFTIAQEINLINEQIKSLVMMNKSQSKDISSIKSHLFKK